MSTDFEFTVAAVPLVRKSDRVKTIRELDLEVASEMKGLVNAVSASLFLLCEFLFLFIQAGPLYK